MGRWPPALQPPPCQSDWCRFGTQVICSSLPCGRIATLPWGMGHSDIRSFEPSCPANSGKQVSKSCQQAANPPKVTTYYHPHVQATGHRKALVWSFLQRLPTPLMLTPLYVPRVLGIAGEAGSSPCQNQAPFSSAPEQQSVC